MVTVTDIIGYIAGTIVVLCLFPQLYEIYINKNVEHISLLTYIILFVGDILWITYGVLLNDLRIILPNAFAAMAVLIIIVMCMLYRQPKQQLLE